MTETARTVASAFNLYDATLNLNKTERARAGRVPASV